MSDTIWLEVSDGQETSGGDRDNSAMLRLSDELDALAIELGVGKLTTFYDSSALAEAYAEELAGADVPEPSWFEASQGRQSVEALLGALRANPAALQVQADTPGDHAILVEELEYCHAALVQAEQRGHRFRLLIVP